MVDPRTAHTIDARVLLAHVPRLDQNDLHDLRREFGRYLSTRASATRHTTWQDAWNAWTGVAPHRPGEIQFTPVRCAQCHGRRFDLRHVARNLSRTGRPDICGECRGTGRGTSTRLLATYITPPATSAENPRKVTP